MSDADNRNPQQPHPDQGWQPLPQGGEYESEATAFVQLPEGFTTGIYGRRTPGYTPGADPLAAPGHGYTPPASFTPHAAAPQVPATGTDPAATGQWTMPFADPSAGYADPAAGYGAQPDAAAHQGAPAAYQGGAPETAQPWGGGPVDWPVAGGPEAGGTGSWSVPAAADDGLEESGEYLVGDDGLTAHTGITGGHPGYQGHPGHPGHPGQAGHQGHQGQQGHQGLNGPGGDAGYPGGYPGADAYDAAADPADPAETSQTGHWNFTTGLSATSGAQTHPTGAPEAPRGGAAPDPFGGSAGDPYAGAGGLAGHQGALPEDESAGGAGVPGDGADPYGPGADGAHAPAATGHWSLPAEALAQWPPASEAAPRPEAAERPDGPADVPAPAGAGGWTVPAADGEQPQESGEFAPGDDTTGSAGSAGSDSPASSGSVDPALSAASATSGASDEPVEPVENIEHASSGAPAEPADRTELTELIELTGPVDAADRAVAADAADGTDGGADPAGSTAPAEAGAPAGAEDPAGPVGDTGPPAAAADPGAAEPADAHDEHPAASYVLRVNGIDRPVTDAWIGESLLYVLRERLGLAGAKDGCSQGECGACSVQVDGRLVASCLVPAATAAGSEVRTVEGLAQNGVPSDVQRALAESGAVQCGFCVPGMAMTVHDLLEGNHAPSELETRKALCGNLCRCSGYRGVLEAVEEVVKARAEAAYAPADAAPDDHPAEAAPQETARIPHQAGPADPTGHAPHHQDPQTGGPA
ncbi:2Fe-2S iron-sulfur cluster-binding protein [Streptomyces sp. NPDC002446]